VKYSVGQRVWVKKWSSSGRIIDIEKGLEFSHNIKHLEIDLGSEEFREHDLESFKGLDVEVQVRNRSIFIHCHGGSKLLSKYNGAYSTGDIMIAVSEKETVLQEECSILILYLKDGRSAWRSCNYDTRPLKNRINLIVDIFNKESICLNL